MFQLLNATDNRRARDDTRRTSCKAVRDTLQVFCRRFCLVHVANDAAAAAAAAAAVTVDRIASTRGLGIVHSIK